MKEPQRTILFLPDGMADEPLAELGGRTPVQHVATPGMDAIARRGSSGTLLTLPKDFPTSSDVANMSVLGCDLHTECCGRGVLEVAAQGLDLGPEDVALRCNLIRVAEDGTLADFSGGHPSQDVADAVVERLNEVLADEVVRFHPGVSYRTLLILRGGGHRADVHCEKPDDHPGDRVADWPPFAKSAAAEPTARLLRDLMARAADLLTDHGRWDAGTGINGIWLWSAGRAGTMRTLHERHGISSAVVSAVDVIRGLGRCLGMEVLQVPGATGYIDTNYEGKAEAAIEAARRHDFVYLHVEAIDEVSHARDLSLKLRAIEDFDRRIVQPVMAACGDKVRYVVLPDHPVPLRLGKHTRTPVPVALCGPGIEPDGVEVFDELAAPCGALGALFGPDLMELLFGPARRGEGS